MRPPDQDPVNRWATEHYGFDVDRGVAHAEPDPGPDPEPDSGSGAGPPLSAQQATAAPRTSRPRRGLGRRASLLGAGVLVLATVAGLAGSTMAVADGVAPGGRAGLVLLLDEDGTGGAADAHTSHDGGHGGGRGGRGGGGGGGWR